jgi:membrane protein implicated in regulation of membrane protease activity
MTFWIVLALVLLHVIEGWWAFALLIATGVFEATTPFYWLRRSQRRRAEVGAEAMMGEVVEVARECRPVGSVRIRGELWKAHCPEGASAGDRVRVTGLDGLTLEVERAG